MKGYTRLPGTARRYLSPTGENISRRQYIQRTTGVTPEARREAREAAGIASHMGRYNSVVKDFKRNNPGEKVRGKKSGEFQSVLAGLRSKDNSPTGPKARALERLGRRSKEWRDYYAVGDSPE